MLVVIALAIDIYESLKRLLRTFALPTILALLHYYFVGLLVVIALAIDIDKSLKRLLRTFATTIADRPIINY